MLQRLSLRLRVFLFFGLLGIGHLAILGASIYVTLARGSAEDPVSALTSTAIMAGFLSFGLVTLVWYLFDENVAKAIETLATELRTRAHGGVDEEIDRATARYLGDLAPAASAMTGSLVEAKTSLEENVAQHTARLSEETERLKTLVGDVPVGLIVCRPSHQMVFYNSPAKDLLAGSGLPRLNRSIFDLLREAPIRKTYDRLVASEGSENDAEILISTVHCARSLAAHMRLVRGALGLGDTPGYVLTLRDVTADLAMHTERERLLSDVVARIRRPAAKLKALIDLHQDLDDPKEAPALTAEILKEADDLTGEVQSIAQLYDDTMRTWWPMQDVRASDLIDGIRAHMEDESLGMVLDAPVPALLLRCDGFALTSLLSQLIRVLHERHLAQAEAVSVTIEQDDPGVVICLAWQGEPLSISDLDTVLASQVDELGGEGLTGREVLDHHGTEVWPEWDHDGRAWLTLPIHEARPIEQAPEVKTGHMAERAAVFDFELLAHTEHAAIDELPLSRLTYVIFDTETTGLNPNGGDEICQIAAVRVLNGKMVQGEVLDLLVDPGRPIPPGATKVHHITDEMVAGQPDILHAGARFHRFAQNAVLVAHNAPFDMAFFHRHGPAIGVSFDNPVLDTVLLSAILFGQGTEHTLDALATRFGVVIPEEARHTALGDTLATAEVFLRMIPMLEAKGITTFGAAMAAMEANNRLMKEMKRRVEA